MANTHSIELERSSSQYLSITDAAQTNLDLTNFTYECWIKFETVAAVGDCGLVIKYVTAGDQRSFGIRFINDPLSEIQIFTSTNGASGTEVARTVSWTPSVDIWYHIACVLNGGSFKFYVNGSQQGTTQTGLGTPFNSTAPLEIGVYSPTGAYLDAELDDIRIWSDERTQSEINNYKATELVGNEANLVAYWKLNNSLLDETSNNNDLTNNGAAVFSTDVPTFSSILKPKVIFY